MSDRPKGWEPPKELEGQYQAPDDPDYYSSGPYGHMGANVSLPALLLAVELSADRTSHEWLNADEIAIRLVDRIEYWYPGIEPHPAMHAVDWDEFYDKDLDDAQKALDVLRDALPLTHAERRWFLALEDQAPNPYDDESRPFLGSLSPEERSQNLVDVSAFRRAAEGQIMEGGLRHVVRGRDLMRRWVTWRLERDEFEGQGSLAIARGAAVDLGEQLAMPHHWPDEYVEQRERIHSMIPPPAEDAPPRRGLS